MCLKKGRLEPLLWSMRPSRTFLCLREQQRQAGIGNEYAQFLFLPPQPLNHSPTSQIYLLGSKRK